MNFRRFRLIAVTLYYRTMITLTPEKIPNFGDANNANFILLTTRSLMPQFGLATQGCYSSYNILPIEESLTATVEQLDENSHILVIAPDLLIKSVEPEKVGQRKIAVMATNSTPTSLEAIEYFIAAMEKTDTELQQQKTERFFARLERSEGLSFINPRYETKAYLELKPEDEWHEQLGSLSYGQQQIIPSGEISVLPLTHGQFNPQTRLKLNGQVVFDGRPIVHTGQHCDRLKQARLFAKLEVLERSPLIATIENGSIVRLETTQANAREAAMALNNLLEADCNYSVVWELGFGINTSFTLYPGNIAMNEVFGGDEMVLHVGLGLTTATEFHLDLLCPGTQINYIF